MLNPLVTTTVLLALLASSADALEPDPGGVFVRVIDVGAGHAAVVQMPGSLHMVYDAGNFTDKGKSALAGVQSVIAEDEEIDLMVLSHSDADHLGAVDKILESIRSGPSSVGLRSRHGDLAPCRRRHRRSREVRHRGHRPRSR